VNDINTHQCANNYLVLGIETSCDETGIGLYGKDGLIDHVIYSQIETHQIFGGVKPEVAAREHVTKLKPLVTKLLENNQLRPLDISLIAFTRGPGLAGPLLVGSSFALGLGLALDCQVIGVNHLEAHVMAAVMCDSSLRAPFNVLLVSGGHSQMVQVSAPGVYQVISQTCDDAAGEAFDKVGKLLGLPYPGGPHLEKLALQGQPTFHLPRPMCQKGKQDMSFSGLKTAVRIQWHKLEHTEVNRANMAASFQAAMVDTLIYKIDQAYQHNFYDRLAVVGGVACNQAIRGAILDYCQLHQITPSMPKPIFCTDNGAMVAHLGWLRRHQAVDAQNQSLEVKPRWPLSSLTAF
jgi:N6-L-threonylcarbamoyladenine synthase